MISLNWVKDYIDLEGEDLNELAVKVTKAGINVEKVITNNIPNIVIGKVLECIPHPDSDHLHICKVDVKTDVLQIVCGAPNVKEGIKVIVALPGAVLPGGVSIKKGSIRGQESNGMITALFELGVEEKTEENYNKGIEILDTDLPVGLDANIYLGTSDTIYELDIHKHRNNDCYYHIGFAYEIACIIGKKVKLPELTHKETDKTINDFFTIDIKTSKCPFYTAKMVKDIKIGDSPDFIKQRLIAAGMRPINNVVDISNYVMLEFGQPLHFFDKKKLGNKIMVRDAHNGEEIITLDGQNRVLQEKDIVITDGEKPVCIAGIMGGENTEVDSTTTEIIIESAIFDSVSIRNTASRLNLMSEASIRYGKGLNYEYTIMAIERACHLLEKYAGATILKDTITHDKVDHQEKQVKFYTKEVNKLLGMNMNDEDVKIELERLDFPYQMNGEQFIVNIPKRRLDIDPNVNDISEEIGRLYGYHNLESRLPKVETRRGVYVGDVALRKQISKRLRALGLNEAKTYTLISPKMNETFRYEAKENIELPNPMSLDKSILRTTLLPSLLNVYDYNKSHYLQDICLYEISKTYDKSYAEDSKVALLLSGNYIINQWNNVTVKVDFYLLKGIIENLLNYLGFKNRLSFVSLEDVPSFHPGMTAKIMLDKEEIGIIGRIHPSLRKEEIYLAEISMTKIYNKKIKPLKYKESAKYPSISKDLAFVVPNNIDSSEIINAIKKSGGRLLTDVHVFDVYQGDKLSNGEKSIAFNLTFQDYTRTLSDDEVMEVFNKIIKYVESNLKAKLRDE